jgi:hypothetical protein
MSRLLKQQLEQLCEGCLVHAGVSALTLVGFMIQAIFFFRKQEPFPSAFGQEKEAHSKRERTIDTRRQVGWTKI